MDFTDSPFRPLLLVVDLLAAATALAGAWFGGRRGGPRGAFVGAAVAMLAWPLLSLTMPDIRGFSLLARVAWVSATVTVPLAAVLHAAATRRARWLVPALLLVAFKWHGEVGEQARLEVTRAVVEVPGLTAPVRVAHLSDLQTDGIRDVERRARESANAFAPDFVVFTGDVLNHPSLTDSVYEHLGGYEAKTAKLFVGGDVDGGLDPEAFARRTGFRWIDGLTPTFKTAGGRLGFMGFGVYDYRLGSDHAALRARQARGADALVALSHRPDAAFALRGQPVSVLFAGHTHGGQVALPFFGPLVTLTKVPRRIAAGGVHDFEGLTVSLSRGLGREGHFAPRVRLFCPPQLILVELVPSKVPSRRASPASRAAVPGRFRPG